MNSLNIAPMNSRHNRFPRLLPAGNVRPGGSQPHQHPANPTGEQPIGVLTAAAREEIAQGGIPDLESLCLDLYSTFFQRDSPHHALQFVPVLQRLATPGSAESERIVQNPKARHILIDNPLLKVVLIHWVPGESSSIHGHPQGGCVFKVLEGRLEEKRYTTDGSLQLLATSTYQAGSLAYLDDSLGYHSVGNPFDSPAISLHAYTPGVR